MAQNIVLLVSNMSSGGAERVAANLVNAWSARGDAVTLVVTFSGRGECFYALSNRVRLIYLSDLAECAGRGFRAYWVRFWALRRLIRHLNPNVVVSFLSNVNIAALLATRGLECRVVVSERTYPPTMPIGLLRSVLRRFTYSWAFKVVMLSGEGVRWMETHIPRAKTVVIPNPVPYPLPRGEPELRPEQFVPSERCLLLAVGRLDEGKQFDLLLESFAALAPRHLCWDLAILGEGPERARLARQIAGHGLARRVILPGRVGNVGDWYGRADLFVMSSRFEGFPNTLAEAMAHGCPTVSYDCDTGPRDIIRHELDGLLVRPVGDVSALTEALDRVMGNRGEREAMAGRATSVRERYSMERILGLWDRVFRET
jgi:GalNAc-alpha-(1->4)-GalNAc-alpha-(1->3)-diNAcBac-PP-undecaprenol alpha-1,4-N-acetyl-D-galactosaminyltransferase